MMVTTLSVRNLQKTEKCFFQTLITFVFGLQVAQNGFLISLLWPKSDLNSPERFVSLSKKTISTSSLKNLQKTEKWFFQTLWTFVFELKVAPKPFAKKILPAKFWVR